MKVFFILVALLGFGSLCQSQKKTLAEALGFVKKTGCKNATRNLFYGSPKFE
jgi:hypothetical protein